MVSANGLMRHDPLIMDKMSEIIISNNRKKKYSMISRNDTKSDELLI